MLICPTAFEPGSFAVVAYIIQSQMSLNNRKHLSCKKVKKFFKKYRHGLLDVAIDEIADPTLDLVNQQTHHLYEVYNHFTSHPLPSSVALSLYLVVLIIAILV